MADGKFVPIAKSNFIGTKKYEISIAENCKNQISLFMATLESGRKNMYVEKICELSSEEKNNKKTQLEFFYEKDELVVKAFGKTVKKTIPVHKKFPEISKTDDVLNYGNFSTVFDSDNNSKDATVLELKPLTTTDTKIIREKSVEKKDNISVSDKNNAKKQTAEIKSSSDKKINKENKKILIKKLKLNFLMKKMIMKNI